MPLKSIFEKATVALLLLGASSALAEESCVNAHEAYLSGTILWSRTSHINLNDVHGKQADNLIGYLVLRSKQCVIGLSDYNIYFDRVRIKSWKEVEVFPSGERLTAGGVLRLSQESQKRQVIDFWVR